MSKEITNHDDVIDSRDVIARIEELNAEQADLVQALTDAENSTNEEGQSTDELHERIARATRELMDWNTEHYEELRVLEALAKEAEGYAPDWRHGETLIRDSYFENYAQELAEDCDMVQDNAKWPYTCIDWQQAAGELRMDYTSVDFDGITYWIR